MSIYIYIFICILIQDKDEGQKGERENRILAKANCFFVFSPSPLPVFPLSVLLSLEQLSHTAAIASSVRTDHILSFLQL